MEDGTSNEAPRMSWRPVTDATDGPVDGDPDDADSGFAFNLGEALARLGDRVPPSFDDTPAGTGDRSPGSFGMFAADDGASAPPAPLPRIFESTSPASFGSGRDEREQVPPPRAAPGPARDTTRVVRSTPEPASTPPLSSPALPTVAPIAVMDAPVLPSAPAAPPVPMGNGSVPAAMAPMQPYVAGRPRKRKKNRVFLKTMLVLMFLGGLGAGAFVYGRAYLFPVEWDGDVAPVAEELETRTGLTFDQPVPVEVLPVPEYGTSVVASMFGADWPANVPTWRALGLASGDVDPEAVAGTFAEWMPAWFDAELGEVRRSESVAGVTRTSAVTDALSLALFLEHGTTLGADVGSGPTGADDHGTVSAGDSVAAGRSGPSIAVRAVADLGSELASGSEDRTTGRDEVAALPAPMAHQLLAIEDLGASIARRGNIEPEIATAADVFTRLSTDALGALDDQPRSAPGPQLPPGDEANGPSRSWGRDAWYLVLAAHLPRETAAAAADAIAADLFTPVRRGQDVCAYGTFTATGPDSSSVLQLSLAAWAMAAPAESAAVATTLPDGTLQLSSCDPGADVPTASRGGAAVELVARQAARLAAG